MTLQRWLARIDDGAILRAAFYVMLAGTLSVLALDYRELTAADASVVPAPVLPLAPLWDPDHPMTPGPRLTTDPATLEAPLAVTLGAGGVLDLTGTIDIGAAKRVAAEIDAHGEYIRSVALDSPGGSVDDALAIGQLIRDHRFSTSVAAGALCASSCPLLLAGGVERHAEQGAAVGVHQVYAAVLADTVGTRRLSPDQAMGEAQAITARIGRYLTGMGVDPALWLKAMETPPTDLAYLTPAEMYQFRLITSLNK
ncbi:MAG TPA: hypothetical protein VGM83_03960 [Devosiaceae bacterium]|jgi:hypothetical protein